MPTISTPEKMTPFLTSKVMSEEYAQNLWYIVSGAVESGFGGGSWRFVANKKENGYKDYNSAGEKDGIPYASLLLNIKLRDEENEEDMSEFKPVTAVLLHNKLVQFVGDEKQPDWLRKMYAEMLVTQEHPVNADAVSDDAFFQYYFTGEIIYG
jgi:hypothetical protein